MGSIPYTNPWERIERTMDKENISWEQAILYLLHKKYISQKEANECNYNLAETRQLELVRALLACARYARDSDAFLNLLLDRFDTKSIHEMYNVKKLEKFLFNGSIELPLVVAEIMERADMRMLDKTLPPDVRLAHAKDKHLVLLAILLDYNIHGPIYQLLECFKSFGRWLATPTNFQVPKIIGKNIEKVDENLLKLVAKKAKRENKENDGNWKSKTFETDAKAFPRVMLPSSEIVDFDLNRTDLYIFECSTPLLDQWRAMSRDLPAIADGGEDTIAKIKNSQSPGFVCGGACLVCALASSDAPHLKGLCPHEKEHKKYLKCPFCRKNHVVGKCKLVRVNLQPAPFRKDWDTVDLEDKKDKKNNRFGSSWNYSNSRRGNYSNNRNYSGGFSNEYFNNYNNYNTVFNGSYNNRGGFNNGRGRSRQYYQNDYYNDRSRYNSPSNGFNSNNNDNSVNNSESRPNTTPSKKEKKKGN